MTRPAIVALLLVSLALPQAAAAQTAPVPLPSPVVKGDWPDPDVSEIDGAYSAVATSGGWAPTFRILRSTDLRGWALAGSVFRKPPRWAKDSFWAPELSELPNGRYVVVYSAYPRRRPGRTWFCLGAATAPTPLGPWRDLGRPLRPIRRAPRERETSVYSRGGSPRSQCDVTNTSRHDQTSTPRVSPGLREFTP